MVTAHQVEKKIPLTILEERVEERCFQYVVQSDSPLDDCLKALEEIKIHIEDIKKKLDEESQKKENDPDTNIEA